MSTLSSRSILQSLLIAFFLYEPIKGLRVHSKTTTSSIKTTVNSRYVRKIPFLQSSKQINRRRNLFQMWGAGLLSSILLPVADARSLSPVDASTAYDSYAPTYDKLDGGLASFALGIDEARSQLFQKAHGRVLEIGVGTGLNLSKYNLEKVTSLTLVDISEGMIQQAKDRLATMKATIPVKFIQADATSQLVDTFGENAFDTVVDSFSLCVMETEGAKSCISQLSKVVKPKTSGGQILLLENSRSSNSALGWYQDLTASAAAVVGGKGCIYNQNVRELIMQAHDVIIENERQYFAGLFRAFECTKKV